MALDPRHPDSDYLVFWREHHLCTLSIPRPDGPPHVTPVGVTYDPDAGLARVITSSFRTKVRHIRAGGERGVPVAVCQVDRGRWATLEGVARIDEDPAAVADAVRRYAERYGRTPRPNPDRVVIEIALTRALGRGTPPQPRAASGG
ncbi:pyridoxamine 5'-phosphate oxidase family protein [Streptomyces bohaiensis]|uniref:pyridoxamine 5'-phosphate oxidase family protein n=1 Tax=Streptomyces bohaiensis TaxID=1431344 RepID=UPI003B76CB5A